MNLKPGDEVVILSTINGQNIGRIGVFLRSGHTGTISWQEVCIDGVLSVKCNGVTHSTAHRQATAIERLAYIAGLALNSTHGPYASETLNKVFGAL